MRSMTTMIASIEIQAFQRQTDFESKNTSLIEIYK